MKPLASKLFATVVIALATHNNWARAQSLPQLSAAAVCPAVKAITAPQLYGMWQVSFTDPPAGLPSTAVMLLERHQEFGDSVAGTVSRERVSAVGHAGKAALAGDVEDGFVILDESSDNQSISGTWNGELVGASCGREIRGSWKDTSAGAPPDAPDIAFVMVKRAGR